MRISDWSSDVCSSDLPCPRHRMADQHQLGADRFHARERRDARHTGQPPMEGAAPAGGGRCRPGGDARRSEEHTSELQSLMRISYAVFCLKKKKNNIRTQTTITIII